MSLERIFKALLSLGLPYTEIRVYIFIATKGPINKDIIIDELKISKESINRSLLSLVTKGILLVNKKHQLEFKALPFEQVLDLLMKAKEEKVQILSRDKDKILSNWLKIMKKNSTE